VLVQNHIRGDNFDVLEASGEKQRALELHARIINIKRLHEAAMIKIDATAAVSGPPRSAPTNTRSASWNGSASSCG